jgi:hypothetical protein
MLPAMFRLIWPSGFRGGDFLKLANQEGCVLSFLKAE